MANECAAQVQACRIRVCRLEADGVPLPGATDLYVSDALTKVAFAWDVLAGDEITEKSACGEIKVNYRGDDNLRRGNVTITLLTPDPYLSELLSGGDVLTGTSGAKGFAAPELGPVGIDAVSIEIWKKRIFEGRLDPTFPYARWVYPWVDHLRAGDHEHNSGNLPMEFVGEAYENDNWLDGPTQDWLGTSDRVYQWLPDTAASLPAASCGYQTLVAS